MRVFFILLLGLFVQRAFASCQYDTPIEDFECGDGIAAWHACDLAVPTDSQVHDKSTGLIWQRCVLGMTYETTGCVSASPVTNRTWQAALKSANNPWRLPNIAELLSITDIRCVNPAMNLVVFPYNSQERPGGLFWSSSPDIIFDNSARAVDFDSGFSDFRAKSDEYYVRLVRTAP